MTNPYSSLRSTWVDTAAAGSLLPSVVLPPLITALNADFTVFEGAQDGVTDDTAALQTALNNMGPQGIMFLPYTAAGTKILGAAGVHGAIQLKTGQCLWGATTPIITGAGPAFGWDQTINPGPGNNNGLPNLKGFVFGVSLSQGAYTPGASAIAINQGQINIEDCAFFFYDSPATYGANCYALDWHRCLFGTGQFGMNWTDNQGNSGAEISFRNCGAQNNHYNIRMDVQPGQDVIITGGFTSLATVREAIFGGNGSADNTSMCRVRDVHMESDTGVVGDIPRIEFTNQARVILSGNDFYEAGPAPTHYFTDDNTPSEIYIEGNRYNAVGYGKYLLTGSALTDSALQSTWMVGPGNVCRYMDDEFRIHPAHSGINNSSFESGDMTGWTQNVATAHVINTDSFDGSWCLEVTGAGANASMSVNCIAPTGTRAVQIGFRAKNLDPTNTAVALLNTGAITGGSLSQAATATIAANSGWARYKLIAVTPPNGCQFNMTLPSATTSGGAVRYDSFYVRLYG